ncbi:hypothetical protein CORC01_01507 [Colletotrichum orchidophilum]|uniref:Uncharacterized protein n=1 Tax=Colletotrichum orchidophilum TaxID=1209926 RepID=A0A1G4BPA4_9PEZI|nr:uncharacterized protein CORC01_01507 [Colletotrichum orchidophilum]OHF03123.1 hypothetical protein CORC01_01507 [Colletotrichum orchidophilum]
MRKSELGKGGPRTAGYLALSGGRARTRDWRGGLLQKGVQPENSGRKKKK